MANIEGYDCPDDLYYHEEHSWAKVEDDGSVRVGMDQFFAKEAGEVTYVDLPFEGDEVEQGDTCGKLQSSKWIGKLFAPVGGEVLEVNEELERDSSLINKDPYGGGWIVRIQPSNLDDDLGNLIKGEMVGEWIKREIKRAEEEKAKSS